ncbi:hypothetical protein HDU98_001558 [Podochytrium sp. JEL0797]|nr:hypothetical protein HDU98_001558 [Podochytrium sp. JEL0797]
MIISIFAALIVIYLGLSRASLITAIVKNGEAETSTTTPEFVRFSRQYLGVYLAAMLADWLQGPYVYRLYEIYGYNQDQIAQLFVAGFGSSMIMGTVVGSLADSCGRRNSCLLFCAFYILSCITKHSPQFEILLAGRILGGISTSILYAAFEFHESQLGSIFAAATTGNGIVAIASGVVASTANDMWGPVAPFDVSAAVLVATAIAIALFWNENYGDNTSTSLLGNFKFNDSLSRMYKDKRILALGISQSLFESAMYIFVFLWTPTLEKLSDDPIQHGWVFACFMVCCMIGSEVFSILLNSYALSVEEFSSYIFFVAGACFVLPVLSGSYILCLVSFLVFEICCGLYWPVMGTLRGKIIPDDVRCTTMTLFRIPLNLIVVVTLMNLKNMQESTAWMMCTFMLLVAGFVQIALNVGGQKGYLAVDKKEDDQEQMELGRKD